MSLPSDLALNRTKSDESAITLHVSPCDPMVKSRKWTDEKHSTYLDYLEASFVQELYQSLHSGARLTKMDSQTVFPSDRLTVPGHESLKKIKCEKIELVLDSTADSRAEVKILRFPHHLQTDINCSPVSPDIQEHITLSNKGNQSRRKLKRSLDHKELDFSNAEASDQNFVDDISERNSSHKSMVKRLKTSCNCKRLWVIEAQGRYETFLEEFAYPEST